MDSNWILEKRWSAKYLSAVWKAYYCLQEFGVKLRYCRSCGTEYIGFQGRKVIFKHVFPRDVARQPLLDGANSCEISASLLMQPLKMAGAIKTQER